MSGAMQGRQSECGIQGGAEEEGTWRVCCTPAKRERASLQVVCSEQNAQQNWQTVCKG